MYRFTILSCLLLVVQGEPLDLMPKCGRFLDPEGMTCCNKKYVFLDDKETLKECMHMTNKAPSCERAICAAEKLGFASADGTIDKKALTAIISKEGETDKELSDAIIETCVEGDLSDFGPADTCDLIKMRQCIQLHMVVDCPEWKSDDACKGAEADAKECIKELL